MAHTENQSWVVDRGGEVVEKRAKTGVESLSDWERLVYCLWVTDYMMRNAGDFLNAEVMYPDFQTDAARFSKSLELATTHALFSQSQRKLQRDYLDRFEEICDEIKKAENHTQRPTHSPEPTENGTISSASRTPGFIRRWISFCRNGR